MSTDLHNKSPFMIPILLVLTLTGISCKNTKKSQNLIAPEIDGTGIKPEDMTHNQAYMGSSYNQIIEHLKTNQYQQDPEQPFPQLVTVKEQLAHQQFLRDTGRTLDSQHNILDIHFPTLTDQISKYASLFHLAVSIQ